MNPQQMDRYLRAAGGNLFLRQWLPRNRAEGGPAFLLFHDSIGSVELWRDLPARLARLTGFSVIAYDRLGFGRSSPRAGKLPPDFIHEEGHRIAPWICDALGLGRIIALGHSVGGGMAIATAAALGQRCLAVIAESAQSFVEEFTLAGVRQARQSFSQPGQLERLARYHGEKARWVLDAWTETWLDPAYSGWTLDSELAQTRCPALILHGDHDEYETLEHPRRIARLLAGPSRLVIFENCGHIPHREQPEKFLEQISGFLASVRLTAQ